MKKYLTYTIAILFATTFAANAAPDEATLKAKDTAAWQAFKDKNADAFKKLVSDKVVGVYPDGIQGMQEEISGMKQSDMKSFTIGNYKVTAAGDDTAVSTYTVKVERTVDGKDVSMTMNAASVWKKEGGEWKAIFHTNIPQQAAAK